MKKTLYSLTALLTLTLLSSCMTRAVHNEEPSFRPCMKPYQQPMPECGPTCDAEVAIIPCPVNEMTSYEIPEALGDENSHCCHCGRSYSIEAIVPTYPDFYNPQIVDYTNYQNNYQQIPNIAPCQ